MNRLFTLAAAVMLALNVIAAGSVCAQQPQTPPAATNAQQAQKFIGSWDYGGPCWAPNMTTGPAEEVHIGLTNFVNGYFAGSIRAPCGNRSGTFSADPNGQVLAQLQANGTVLVMIANRATYTLQLLGDR